MTLYSLIGPLIHWKSLRGADEVRMHNGPAAFTAVITHLLFGGRLVARFGFIWSLDMVCRGVSGWRLWTVLASEWLACRCATRIEVSTVKQKLYLRQIHGID